MTTIYFHFLVFISVLYLTKEKFRLQEKGASSKYKFIYKLTKCDFCFDFWNSVLTVIFINIIGGSTWDRVDLMLPFTTMGIWLLTQKILKWVE